MSGLVKAKKYDWKDSNMALFGTDTEKQVKKESAECEPAWQGCGQEVGVKVWRIVKFKVENWLQEDYGKFYDGDSYIILNTYKDEESDQLLYDVHFWIGQNSTQDEYGTAAYKTVELDTFLDDVPVQHREVQGHETSLFRSYFQNYTILKGGADSGFRHVLPEEYRSRLLKFNKEGKKISMKEVPRNKDHLHDGDVFILDRGLEIYQWNGQDCNGQEKFRATQEMQAICSERGGRPKKQTLDQNDMSPEHWFYDFLDEDDGDDVPEERNGPQILKKVSDQDGSIGIEDVKEGEDITRGDLSSDDVFLVDVESGVFVWVGSGASVDERRNAMAYAHNYLQKTEYPFMPITVVVEGKESKEFLAVVAGCA